MLSNASIGIVKEPNQKYCLEIKNENRSYVLASKHEHDFKEWFQSI